jgi:hypothetical protein
MAVAEDDVPRVLEFLRGLHASRDQQGLTEYILASLPQLIPGEATAFSEVSLTDGRVHWATYPPTHAPEIVIGAHVHALARACTAHHPAVRWYRRTRSGEAVRISDLVTQREFHDLRVYQELYRPLRTEDQLSIRFPRPRHLMASLAICRSGWGFTDREKALLAVTARTLVHCSTPARLQWA